MHRAILPHVIFSPGHLAIELAEGLAEIGIDLTFFTPGPVDTKVRNVTADLSYFERELKIRGDSYMNLLKKHPFTFVTLARQVQSELVAKAFAMANRDELDVVHIYTNEEDVALPFAALCKKPVVFTHHDPFNFLVKYKNVFPKYSHLNWLSMSLAQRKGMPDDTNWVGNIYHGLGKDRFKPNYQPTDDYFAYLGRIIQPKGLHLAIQAAKQAGVKLKIAGKHYAGTRKDDYWNTEIEPQLGGNIEYVGFIDNDARKQAFLGNARALIVPSIFDEPFGMVMIEALACGTPVIGLNSGAIPEVIENGVTGFVVDKNNPSELVRAIEDIETLDRHSCRQQFEARFTLEQMCNAHAAVYVKL
jgi:glycosyltransferase involved in cell wall biosynthesis